VIRRGKLRRKKGPGAREIGCAGRSSSRKWTPTFWFSACQPLDAGRAEEIRNRLLDAEKQGIHKVILDVRECGRGRFPRLFRTARLFLPSGTVTTLRGQTVSTQVFSAEPKQVIWKNPVSVLVDATDVGGRGSSSFRHRTNHRGDVVGERTFGLASEQKLITLDDGAALILTVANYYNPGGKSILERRRHANGSSARCSGRRFGFDR